MLKSLKVFSVMFLFSNELHSNVVDASNHAVNSMKFDVYLNDKKIGVHTYTVIENNNTTKVISSASFKVTFMYIPVYSYQHRFTEIWKNDCLLSMDSRTNDNGDEQYVLLSKNDKTNYIETNNGTSTKSGCVRSFAYWNSNLLKYTKLLNSQTGELVNTKYEVIEEDSINTNMKKYKLTGKSQDGSGVNINIVYKLNQWVALESTLDNGRVLSYQLSEDVQP